MQSRFIAALVSLALASTSAIAASALNLNNYSVTGNHVLKAMPGLPREEKDRHTLTAALVSRALLH